MDIQTKAFREIEKMLKRLKEFRSFADLERDDDLHIQLTSAQDYDLEEAIKSLERMLNPV